MREPQDVQLSFVVIVVVAVVVDFVVDFVVKHGEPGFGRKPRYKNLLITIFHFFLLRFMIHIQGIQSFSNYFLG